MPKFELALLQAGTVEHFDLCDVSSTSLESAMERADRLGVADRITIRCGDLLGADRNDYGLVTFVSSLHHAVDVATTVRFAHDILRPGGVLYADEYVGPRRFDYPPEHGDLVKALYRSLAPNVRGPWPELPQPDPADVAAADPTEAAQSDLILDALHTVFADVELAPIYGALAFILWWGLDHDALWDTQHGRDLHGCAAHARHRPGLLRCPAALFHVARRPTRLAAWHGGDVGALEQMLGQRGFPVHSRRDQGLHDKRLVVVGFPKEPRPPRATGHPPSRPMMSGSGNASTQAGP